MISSLWPLFYLYIGLQSYFLMKQIRINNKFFLISVRISLDINNDFIEKLIYFLNKLELSHGYDKICKGADMKTKKL